MSCRDEPFRTGETDSASDCRCLCGSLLARVVGDAVELRCRRCKRTLLIPLAEGAVARSAAPRPVEVIPVRRAG